MTILETTQPVPLAMNEDGVIRFAGSRVSLDSVVHQFQAGATAEQIQEDFPSLSLGQIYGAITYYLEHTEPVEAYLHEAGRAASRTRIEIERGQDSAGLRERLRRRRGKGMH